MSQLLPFTDEQAAAVRGYLEELDHSPRITMLMLGEADVGKTTLIHRLHVNSNAIMEAPAYDPTSMGSSMGNFALHTHIEGKYIAYEGDKESPLPNVTAINYPHGYLQGYGMLRHCETCVFIYDVGNKASFEAVKWYHQNLQLERSLERPYCGFGCSPCKPRPPYRGLIFVIANKIDRPWKKWDVPVRDGQDFCASNGAIFIPMSAEMGDGGGKCTLLTMTKQVLLKRASILASSRETQAIEDAASSSTFHDTPMTDDFGIESPVPVPCEQSYFRVPRSMEASYLGYRDIISRREDLRLS